ncbi:MAG: hypothetical protein E7523_04140 [Ruminococcaceae bacterium]|nr:hypothetical protein [Oscillospiraceae bacterium]
MFPSVLDKAEVLYYTHKDDYGVIRFPDCEKADLYRYLAICKYANDNNYYLFCCNENFEVVSDTAWDSAEQCMQIAASYKTDIEWIKLKDEY